MTQRQIIYEEDKHGYQRILIILVLLIGILNSQRYFYYIGLNNLYDILLLLFYALLGCSTMVVSINCLFKSINLSLNYWGILFVAVIFKYFLLFVQSPTLFIPMGNKFIDLITFMCSFAIMITIIAVIRNMYYLKRLIWALGISSSFTVIIPLIFFPEMIGTRVSNINGYFFSGSFWNAAVISYMSVGWLLVALTSKESSRLKNYFLVGLFMLLIAGSLAGLSRASLVSIILSLIVYLLASNKFTKYIKVIFTLLILSVILIPIFQDTINNFVLRIDGGIEIDEEPRTFIWLDYLEDVPDYLVFGEITGDYLKYSETRHGPHSVFLNWFSQFGILGLVGFLILLYGIISSIGLIRKYYSKQTAAALYAWLVAYLSIATINETGFVHYSLFCAFGIIIAWGRVVRKIKETEDDIQ